MSVVLGVAVAVIGLLGVQTFQQYTGNTSAVLVNQGVFPKEGEKVFHLMVNQSEFALVSGGPISVHKIAGDGVLRGLFFVEGGIDHGNVIVLPPGNYYLDTLIPKNNWYGKYQGSVPDWSKFVVLGWPANVYEKVDAMFRVPNCVSGCNSVDIVFASSVGIYGRWNRSYAWRKFPMPGFTF